MARATRVREWLISVDEAADFLETTPATIRALVRTGNWIGSQYVNHTYVIPRAAFHRLYRDGLWHDDSAPAPIPFLTRRKSA